MFAHSYSKLSRTCYGESTPYALQKSKKSSVLRWLQKHDDDDDEEKSRTAAGYMQDGCCSASALTSFIRKGGQ